MSDEITAPNAAAGQTGAAHGQHQAQPPAPQRTRAGCCLGRIVSAVVTVVLAFVVLANTVAPYRVSGPAMQPTLRDGQTILAHTVRFLGITILPNRGDIVLYHPNDHVSNTTIGRVVAIPGDTIQVTAAAVILNGRTLDERYIAAAPAGQQQNPVPYAATKLGLDQYFILGDDRPNSDDSRNFGPVTFDHIVADSWITVG